ncbi:MAG: metallophosphoesterase family protein [Candidatus Zixiibacteriota bacterium]
MKLAVLSDVHANLEALKAVVRDIESKAVEKVFFLGDAVGYGANPNECVEIIDSLCEIKLLGNHDYVALGLESSRNFNPMAQKSIKWTQEQLTDDTVARLSDFEMEGSYLDFYMVHATPDNPLEWNYILGTQDAYDNFDHFSQRFCLVGHSHLPCVFRQEPGGNISASASNEPFLAEKKVRYIINVGSVGQPRDGIKDACYLLIDTDEKRFEFIRVAYELDKAQEKMQNAQLPEYLITRLASGK